MKDNLEHEIREGSVIVYPGRHSSSLWMNEGVVVEVKEWTEESRIRYGTRKGEIEYKKKATLSVDIPDEDTMWSGGQSIVTKFRWKRVTLTVLSRVYVIPGMDRRALLDLHCDHANFISVGSSESGLIEMKECSVCGLRQDEVRIGKLSGKEKLQTIFDELDAVRDSEVRYDPTNGKEGGG